MSNAQKTHSIGVINIKVEYLNRSTDEWFLVYKKRLYPCLLSMECLKKLWLIPQEFPHKQLEASNDQQD